MQFGGKALKQLKEDSNCLRNSMGHTASLENLVRQCVRWGPFFPTRNVISQCSPELLTVYLSYASPFFSKPAPIIPFFNLKQL